MTIRLTRKSAVGGRRLRIVFLAIIAFGGGWLFIRHANAIEPAVVVKLNDSLKFTPAKVTVKAGDTIRWRNASVLVHTVTDDPDIAAKKSDYDLPKGAKPFNSGNLAPNATFEHTFTTPGHYRYFCMPHEAAGMVAEVEVVK